MYKVKNIGTIPDENSAFYAEIRPICILGKIFGIFPFTNLFQTNGALLTYKWYSVHTIYGILMQIICILVYTQTEKNAWFQSISPLMTTRETIIMLTCMYYEQFVLDIIRNVEEFDKQYQKLSGKNVTERKLHCFLWAILASIEVILKIIVCMFFTKKSNYQNMIAKLGRISGVVSLIIRSIYIYTYIVICFSVSSRFRDLLEQWRYIMKKYQSYQPVYYSKNVQADYLEADHLEGIRLLHGQMTGTVKLLNVCYGIRFACLFGMMFLEILSDLYMFLYLFELRSPSQIMFNCMNVIDIIS
ncbi:hypothetical protein L9F63_014914, partial [Diploptera punctata]